METTPPVSLFDSYLTDPTRPHESHESHESHELHELHELHEYARVRTRRRDTGTVGKIAKCKTGGVVSIFLQSFAQRNESNMTTSEWF